MRIKSWRKFFESVEDSVEDIKWMLVDYDYDESIYLKSESLIVYKLNKDVGDPDYFKTTERITRLSKPEGWDVTFIPKQFVLNLTSCEKPHVALIFYKGNLEECILSWLKENYDNLEHSLEPNTYHSGDFTEYCDESGESIFIHRKNSHPMSPTGQVVEVQPILYSLPMLCLSKYEEEDVYTKLCNLLKSWFKESYDIDVSDNNIYFEE